jgi:choline dehydrogenase-like flavoprotein
MTDPYDAIVVGSGATGGWAAKELTQSGLRVALLEAGPKVTAGPGGAGAVNDEARQDVQSLCHGFNPETSHLYVDDEQNPYCHPEDQPFHWIRSRQLGGRLHVWNRMCLRMSDRELKAATRDGVGEDWPISYADLAPHYNRVERFLEVCGTPEQLPNLPDGDFLGPPAPTAGERAFKSAVERLWSTRRVTSSRIAQAPADAMLAAARQTGRLTLHTNSIASRITLTKRADRAHGVLILDRLSEEEREISGRAIVLCASTIESTRLLLNSATADHPQGLANSSGALGRYLMDHTFGVGLDGVAPLPRSRHGESPSYGCLVPAFRNVSEPDLDFIRSYGVQLQVMPPAAGRLGRLRRLVRNRGWFWMRAFGEVLPTHENHVSIDPGRTDAWGIPIARIACRYGENERRMARDQLRRMEEMAEAASWRVAATHPDLAPPGSSVHELGTARMGEDPSISVLNPHNQCWDVENLFVTDGSCFTSAGCQNPTLTMMAITGRACEHIVERMKQRLL